jgi:hypothetical protein
LSAAALTIAFASLSPSFAASTQEKITFKTRDGRTFTQVKISRVDPSGLHVLTRDGIERIPFSALSDELQKRFGYDRAEAAKHEAEVALVQARLTAASNAQRLKDAPAAGKPAPRRQLPPPPAPPPPLPAARAPAPPPALADVQNAPQAVAPRVPPLGTNSALNPPSSVGGTLLDQKRYSVNGVVVQTLHDGAIVDCWAPGRGSGYKPVVGYVFIRGELPMKSGFVKGQVISDGDYTNGNGWTMPAFRVVH